MHIEINVNWLDKIIKLYFTNVLALGNGSSSVNMKIYPYLDNLTGDVEGEHP